MTIEPPLHLPTPDEARETPFAISLRPGVTKSGKSFAFYDAYKGATTSQEYFRLHSSVPSSTKGRQNADWKHDMLKAKPPIFFFQDARLRALQRQETGFVTADNPRPTPSTCPTPPSPRSVADASWHIDATFTMADGGAEGILPKLMSGFEQTDNYRCLAAYVDSLSDAPVSAPSVTPDDAPAPKLDSDNASNRPPTRMKFHDATKRLTELYSKECADALHITDEDFAFVRSLEYLDIPKSERTVGQNCDLDELMYDNLFWHHISDGGVDEIVLLSEQEVSPDNFIFHEDKIADLHHVPHAQKPQMYSAIVKELTDLAKNGTFADIQIPHNRKPIKGKWVLKVKYRADGAYDKHKARLVAKGFLKRLGIDFFACFSPMATMTTIRIIFAVAVHLSLRIIHADIPQAFIQAKIDADIWFELPYGVEYRNPVTGTTTRILKLLKSLYGLRQAALAWSRHLHHFLTKLGFAQAAKDQCLYYTFDAQTGFVLLGTEVDDLVITGTDNNMIERLHSALVAAFDMNTWEDIRSFLGMHIDYSVESGTLEMSMTKKFDTMFDDLHPTLGEQINGNAKIPLKGEYSHILENVHKVTPLELYVKNNYASIVGSLIFIMISVRPDIALAVGRLARHMHNPTIKTAVMAVDVLNYCKRTRKHKLTYKRQGNPIEGIYRQLAETNNQLFGLATTDKKAKHPMGGFSDANHAPPADAEFRSTSGYVMFVLFCLVSWKSKLQSVTAQSTHESELIALSLACNEAVWIRDLLITIGFALCGHTIVRPRGSEPVPELDVRNDDDNIRALGKSVPEAFVDEDHDDGLKQEIEPYTIPPVVIANDNQSTNFVASNPTTSFRNRHIGSRYWQCRNYVRNQQALPTHIPTKLNVADLFTKPITEYQLFVQHCRACGIVDPE